MKGLHIRGNLRSFVFINVVFFFNALTIK